MSFVTTTLRDTVVNAAGAGGTVTVKAIFDNDTADNLILDAHGLSGFANGAKLDLVPSENGKITARVIDNEIKKVRELALQPNTFYTDQFKKVDNRNA